MKTVEKLGRKFWKHWNIWETCKSLWNEDISGELSEKFDEKFLNIQ